MQRVAAAFPVMLRIGFAASIAYRAEIILWMLTMTTPLISLALWSAVAASGPVGNYNQAQFADYFLVVLVVRQITGAWVTWTLNQQIREGTLSMMLLRPIHPLWAFLAENVSAIPLRLATAIPASVVVLFFLGSHGSSYAVQWLAILPAMLGVILLRFFFGVIIGALAFWLGSAIGPFMVWNGLFAALSGYVVPTTLFPGWLANLAEVLPFRYALGFPVELMLGRLSAAAVWQSLAIQWAYILVVGLLALHIFQRGIRRYEAYGS